MWDVKRPSAISDADFGKLFLSRFMPRLAPSQSVISLTGSDMDAFFGAVPDDLQIGKDISEIKINPTGTDPMLWANTAESFHVSFLGMGVSPDLRVDVAPWFGPLSGALNARDHGSSIKKVYFWTVNAPGEMRRLLDMGLDGMIVDDGAALEGVLAEEPYRTLYRKATVSDSQFQAHGTPLGPG
jgi:hypothetical protein